MMSRRGSAGKIAPRRKASAEGAESFRGGGIVEDAEGFALLFGDRDHRAVHERDGGAGDAQERAAFLVARYAPHACMGSAAGSQTHSPEGCRELGG